MKKMLVIAALISAVVLGCKTTGSGSGSSSGGGSGLGQLTTDAEVKEAFEDIYDEFRHDIILDGAKAYVVVANDRLVDIARREYGDGYYFPLIILASDKVVLDPDKIEVGDKLIIPDLQRNLNDAKAKSSLKACINDVAGLYDRRPNRASDARNLRNLSAKL
jgi:hypothetical protein